MKIYTTIIIAMFFFASITSVKAATIEVDGNGILTGATDIDIDGTLYDVLFVDGSCAGLYDGCDELSDFNFTTEADAVDATLALLGQVFISNPFFGANPEFINGCSDDMECDLFTPYSILGSSITFSTLRIRADDERASIFDTQRGRDEDTLLVQQATTARFTLVQTNVPEPSTLALLLMGMVAMRRGRQQKYKRGIHYSSLQRDLV